MDNQFAAVNSYADGKSTEQQLQDEIAGDDVKLNFVIQGQTDVFHSEVFKQG